MIAGRYTYRPHWRDLFRRHQDETRLFEQRESRLFGKITNVLKAIDQARLVRGEDHGSTIGDAFRFISSAGARREALERAHEKAHTDLHRQQEAATRSAVHQVRQERSRLLAQDRDRFAAEVSDLRLGHQADQAVMRASWKTRTYERKAVWRTFQKEAQLQRQSEADLQNTAARDAQVREAPQERSAQTNEQSQAPGTEGRSQERSRSRDEGQHNE